MSARGPRYWRCRRQAAGQVCGTLNLAKYRKCSACGKRRPAKRPSKQAVALKAISYETLAAVQGETCWICGAGRGPAGRRLHRDHDHRTGAARGLLCFRCNSGLRDYMTAEWLREAACYLDAAARRTNPMETR